MTRHKERSFEREYRGTRWGATADGGYVNYFEDIGKPRLFARRMIGRKDRGGLFACVPQFGPDARIGSELAQHGFLRTSTLSVGRIANAGFSMTFEQTSGAYAGLTGSLTYRFNRAPNSHSSIYAGLSLHNDGDHVMRIAPAFHPYIDLSGLDGVRQRLIQQDLEQAQTVSATKACLQVSEDDEVVVSSRGFTKMTWWSGRNDENGEYDEYVCIEPSLIGPSFGSHPDDPRDVEILEPGELRDFEMSLEWRPIKPKQFVRNEQSLKH